MKRTSVLFASLFALALPAGARAEDTHHPQTAPEASTAAPAVSGPSAMGMMAMMPDMMRMMGMMQEMGDATSHVEGRIAFLHAELAITEAQEPAWKALADALRQNAAGLKQATPADHGHGDASVVFGQLLEQQHRLEARLDGLRAINAALAPLVDALSDEQRRTLDDLFPHVAGLMDMAGMMPMQGMMPGAAGMSGMSGMAKPTP